MHKHVTEEHFDASIAGLDKKFVTIEHFDASIAGLDKKFVTKDEFHTRMDDVMTKMGGMSVILRRLDQERIFSVEWIKRIESDVTMVKRHLKLA